MDALIELIDNFALMKLIIVRLPLMNPFNTNLRDIKIENWREIG